MDALRRVELIDELEHANEEAARLSEMIVVLGKQLDDSRLNQLRIELIAIGRRAARLTEELSTCDHSGSAAAA